MVKKFGNQDAEKNHFSKQMKFRKRSIDRGMPSIRMLALEGMAGVFERTEFTYCTLSEMAKKHWRFECDQVEQFLTDACDLRSSSHDIFKS